MHIASEQEARLAELATKIEEGTETDDEQAEYLELYQLALQDFNESLDIDPSEA